MALLMYVVPQVIRTVDQVKHVIWAIIAALGLRVVEIVALYAGAGFSFEGSAAGWGSHEDAGFLAVFIIFAIAMHALAVRNSSQKAVLTSLLLPALVALVATDRRTAYPVLGAGIVMLILLLPPEFQRKMVRLAWKVGIVFVIYLGVFWNSGSDHFLLKPVISIREGIGGDDKELAGDSYTSNLYRKVENYDLCRMARQQPLLGYGYGSLIDYVLPIPLEWDLGFYVTHNQILCVLAKTGIVGFTIFAFFYLSAVASLARGYREIDDAYLHSVLALVGADIINHLVYSFFDITLTFYRTNILLGTLLGVTTTILAVRRQQPKEVKEDRPERASASSPARWLLAEHKQKDVEPVQN
jgi:O-antigen ligase